MKYAIRIYFWCHLLTSLDFVKQKRAPPSRHGCFGAGLQPVASRRLWLRRWGSRPQCCPRASANGPHQPSSLSGTGASFSTTLDSERGYLELDLSITTVFVVMTEHKLRLPDLQPAPGLWSNATGAVPTHTARNSFLGQATILSQMAQATHLQQPCLSLQGHSLEVYMNHSVSCFMIFTGLKQIMVRWKHEVIQISTGILLKIILSTYIS